MTLNWQPLFDSRTFDLGHKMYESGRPSTLIGCLPYSFSAKMDKTAERLQKCHVHIEIDEKTELIEKCSCTCESFCYSQIPCRHIAATMFTWESLKDSKEWYDFFHGYRTCSDKDIEGIKNDIDQDFLEYEREMERISALGMLDSRSDFRLFHELHYAYGTVGNPFKRIAQPGNYINLFEIYRYLAEKASNFKYYDDDQKKSFYNICAGGWEQVLFYGNANEKAYVNLMIERFLTLNKKDYRYICAKILKNSLEELFESPRYKLRRRISSFLKTIPQGYVVTCKSIAEHIKRDDLIRHDLVFAMECPDLEHDMKAYKLVKANGEMSEYLSGLKNNEQKEMLEKEGASFVGNRIDMEQCLY